jgi:hypothetical protein
MNENTSNVPSRYEMNHLVRSVLSRHAIDLELLSISCSASIVYLYGCLKRVIEPGLNSVDIDVIFKEIEWISLVRGIVTDFENWIVTSGDGAWSATPKGRTVRSSTGTSAQEENVIKKEERLTDVLDDIKKNT